MLRQPGSSSAARCGDNAPRVPFASPIARPAVPTSTQWPEVMPPGEMFRYITGREPKDDRQVENTLAKLRAKGCPFLDVTHPYTYPLEAVREWVRAKTVYDGGSGLADQCAGSRAVTRRA